MSTLTSRIRASRSQNQICCSKKRRLEESLSVWNYFTVSSGVRCNFIWQVQLRGQAEWAAEVSGHRCLSLLRDPILRHRHRKGIYR